MTTVSGACREFRRLQPEWTCVARAEDLRGDGPLAVSVHGTDLVVLRTPSGLRAYEGRCPHQGALLGEGEIDGKALSSAAIIDERFDADSGKRSGASQCLRACPIELRDGALWLDARVAATFAVPQRQAVQTGTRRVQDLPGPRGIPVLGNALQLETARIHQVLHRNGIGCTARSTRFVSDPKQCVAIADAPLVEQILRARPETYRRIGNIGPVFRGDGDRRGFLGRGGRMATATEAFDGGSRPSKSLRQFYPTRCAALPNGWCAGCNRPRRDARVLDIQTELMRFTVDVTTTLAFGIDANTLEGGEDVIQKHLSTVFPAVARRINSPIPYWRYVRLPADRKLDRALRALREWIGPLISETRARLEADPARAASPSNFLEAMIVARDAEGRPFDR